MGNFQRLARLAYILGAACAVVLMFSLFAAAFWEIGRAVFVFFRLANNPQPLVPYESSAIAIALKGIEYLFLAPMSFLVYRGLARYMQDTAQGNAKPGAEAEVTESKRLVTGLMFAVVSTDLIGKMLSPDGLIAKQPVYELCLLVILGGYTFVLHKMRP